MSTIDPKSEKGKFWKRLLDVWDDDTPACQVYVAEAYTRKFPDDFFGWLALADGLTGISAFRNAAVALQTALRLCPSDLRDWAYTKVGHYYREKGDVRRSERWYRKAVAFSEKQANLVFLGGCLAKQGRYDEAKHFHNRAALLDPAKAEEALFNLGLICRAESKYVEALRYFNKSIGIDPNYDIAKVARQDIMRVLKIQAAEKRSATRRKTVRRT